MSSFRKKAETELMKASKEKREPKKLLRDICPLRDALLLVQFDSMAQTYLLTQSQQECTINMAIANATAHVLIKTNPQVVENIDLESSL